MLSVLSWLEHNRQYIYY